MVTLHEVITFLVSMQISISSLQTHNVNRCGRSRHLARKLSLRRKRSSMYAIVRAEPESVAGVILTPPAEVAELCKLEEPAVAARPDLRDKREREFAVISLKSGKPME